MPHARPRPDGRGDAELYDRVCADVFGEDWDPARRVCRPIAERRLHPDLARIPGQPLRATRGRAPGV
ncbi:MAG: hypothetical protein Q8P41_12315 [Pseudomonadota bacterium]|nr:hypothetical protein [Pseudomonadota bacterium]